MLVPLTVTDFIQLMESEAFPVTVMDGVLRRASSSGEVMVISGSISSVPSNTTVNALPGELLSSTCNLLLALTLTSFFKMDTCWLKSFVPKIFLQFNVTIALETFLYSEFIPPL